MSPEEIQSRSFLANIIIQAWNDSEVLNSLVNNPIPTLTSFGLTPPPGVNIKIYADDATKRYVIGDMRWAELHGQDFMNTLNNSPAEALATIGYNINENLTYSVVFNAHNVMNIVIPLKPSPSDLSIEKIR